MAYRLMETSLSVPRICAVTVLVAVMSWCFDLQAQVQKCKGPDGKTIYSDTACQGNVSSQSVKTSGGGSTDSASLKKDNQRFAAEADAQQVDSLMQEPPTECKFRYFAIGDDKGKVLATNAKRECIENLLARKRGRQASTESYDKWKDHFDQVSSGRSAALSRAATDQLTNAVRQNSIQANAPVTCRNSGSGAVTCQ
jgi:hypothetical protein